MNKPCPWCGVKPAYNPTSDECYCHNPQCPVYHTFIITAKEWNTRAPSEDQQELARTAGEALTENVKLSQEVGWLLQEIDELRKEIQQLSKE